jgi:hypothetical protein
MDVLAQPVSMTVPTGFVLITGAYCLLYIAGVLAIGLALFQRREMEAQAASSTMPGVVNLLSGLGRAGALIVAIGGLILLSVPAFYTLRGLLLAAGLLVGGAAGWILWGCFGRGARWSYWVAVAAVAAGLLASVAGLWAGGVLRGAAIEGGAVLLVLCAVATAMALGLLMLPRTRHHFRSQHARP